MNDAAKGSKSPQRSRAQRRPKETAPKHPKKPASKQPKDRRRSPRYPGNKVWSDATRERHRVSRDRAIEDAGLVTDRMIEKGGKVKSDD